MTYACTLGALPVDHTVHRECLIPEIRAIYLFIYYVMFTQEYPISAQHCSPWGSCKT